jgi:hypothetical protein
MVLLGAVSALLIVALLAIARRAWRGAGHPRLRFGPPARSARYGRNPRRPRRPATRPGPDADAALRRHPAGRGRHAAMVPGELAGAPPAQWPGPVGPDDDPEFIDALERLIRGDGDGTCPGG